MSGLTDADLEAAERRHFCVVKDEFSYPPGRCEVCDVPFPCEFLIYSLAMNERLAAARRVVAALELRVAIANTDRVDALAAATAALRRDAESLASIEVARALHEPSPLTKTCRVCLTADGHAEPAPCPTVRALVGATEPAAGAESENRALGDPEATP